jgi:DHA1 family multidrug resistance protein-like MFS transporter
MESWKKTLYISWAVLFFHTAGLGMLMPFLPLYVKELGVTDPKAQAVWSGIIYGVAYIFTALLAPLWGTISDKYGRKPLILRTTFGIGVIALLMSFVTNVYQLLGLRILHGICGGTMPAFIALVSRGLPEDKTGQGLGAMQTALLAGNLIGPFMGGVLSDLIGYRNVLLVIALLTLIAGITTLLFIHEQKRDPAQARSSVLDNMKLVTANINLRMVCIVILATQFSIFIVQPILPLFIASLHGTGSTASMVGLVFSVTGLATMLFTPYWGKAGDKKGHRNVLIRSLLFNGIAFFPQALVTSVYQLLPLRAVIGFFVAGIEPSTQSLLVKNTNDSQRGGVLGITHSVRLCGQALGPLVGGALGALFGYRVPFVLTAVLLILIAYFFGKYLRDTDQNRNS